MKKTIIIFLLVCLTAITFIACDRTSDTVPTGNTASIETENPQKAEASVEETAAPEPVESLESATGDSEAGETTGNNESDKTEEAIEEVATPAPTPTYTPAPTPTPTPVPTSTSTPTTSPPPSPEQSLEPDPNDSQTDNEADNGNAQPLKDGEIMVSTFAEFQGVVKDAKITVIYIGSDLEITSEFSFERNDDLAIYIKEGTTFTVNNEFLAIGCSITNDGAMIINGSFERGICNFTNNGSVKVGNGGTVSSGMSGADNNGEFIIDNGGQLLIERGSEFKNLGELVNNGYISVNDGGSLFNETGSLQNNGIIDLNSYFNGDIENITGTGTLNDNR